MVNERLSAVLNDKIKVFKKADPWTPDYLTGDPHTALVWGTCGWYGPELGAFPLPLPLFFLLSLLSSPRFPSYLFNKELDGYHLCTNKKYTLCFY